MSLNFPSGVADGTVWTDPNGEQWVYNANENSWTSKGLVNNSGGLKYKGSIDITATAPAALAVIFIPLRLAALPTQASLALLVHQLMAVLSLSMTVLSGLSMPLLVNSGR